jgi:hypothetical protein
MVGFLAALLPPSFAPQAWLTFRSRDVSGIPMYSAFTGCWPTPARGYRADDHTGPGALVMKLAGAATE